MTRWPSNLWCLHWLEIKANAIIASFRRLFSFESSISLRSGALFIEKSWISSRMKVIDLKWKLPFESLSLHFHNLQILVKKKWGNHLAGFGSSLPLSLSLLFFLSFPFLLPHFRFFLLLCLTISSVKRFILNKLLLRTEAQPDGQSPQNFLLILAWSSFSG